ncbi:MAG: hypothetical protein WC761_05270, partial [Candidatus Paceibacterota bacterium]
MKLLKIIITLAIFALASSASAATLSKPSNNLGLVGYWSFEDATSTASVGTKVTDFSGRGNTGTLTNGPTWTDGKKGKALSFDGSNDEVTTATNYGNTASLNTLTVSVWFKTSVASGKKIIGLEDAQTGTGGL